MIIRNWRDSIPYIGHESKIIWPILTRAENENAAPQESACLLGLTNFTRHVVQGRITTDYHDHKTRSRFTTLLRAAGRC